MDARRRRSRQRLGRLLQLEILETRQLLAANLTIGLNDFTSSYISVVNGSTVTYTPVFSDAEIGASVIEDALNAGFDVIVETATGAATQPGDIIFSGSITVSNVSLRNLSFRADQDIIFVGQIQAQPTGDLNVELNADRDATGGGSVQVTGLARVATQAGNITVGGGNDPATMFAQGRVGQTRGVTIDGGTLQTVAGNVLINGQGLAGANDAAGVFIRNAQPNNIITRTGSISINGIADAGASGSNSDGVRLTDSADITTGTGAITIIGQASGQLLSSGVEITAGSQLTSDPSVIVGPVGAIGAITINGTTSSAGGQLNVGVQLIDSFIDVTSAAVNITGISSDPTIGIANNGVELQNSFIFSSDTFLTALSVGAINITGQSNSPLGSSVNGIILFNGSIIQGNDAAIMLTGSSTGSATSSGNRGVVITGSASVQTIEANLAGPITVIGNGVGDNGDGVRIENNATLGGLLSPVTVMGTSANDNASGFILIAATVQGENLDLTGIAQSVGGVGVSINGVGTRVNANRNLLVTGSTTAANAADTGLGIQLDNSAAINAAAATFVSTGRLFVNEVTITVPLQVSFETVDRSSFVDDIEVFGSTFNLENGDVVFDAGDNLTIDAASTLSGNFFTANIDSAASDPDVGLGGGAFINATLNFAVIINLFGGADRDQFSVTSSNVSVNIDGGGQPLGQGDFVNVDGLGGEVVVTPTLVSIPSISNVQNLVNVESISLLNTDTLGVVGDATDNDFSVGSFPSSAVINRTNLPSISYDPSNVNTVSVDGLDGDDTFVVDFSGGVYPGIIDFDGGTESGSGIGDHIFLQGAPPIPINSLQFNYTNATDGSIDIDGTRIINYTGRERLTSALDDVPDVFLMYGVSNKTIELSTFSIRLTAISDQGNVTFFNRPTANIIVNPGDGTNTVNIDNFQVTLSGALSVDETNVPKDDTVSFINNSSSVTTGSIDLAVLNVDVNVDLNADGDIVFGRGSNVGTIRTAAAITSAGEIVFDEKVSLQGTTSVTTDNDSLIGFHYPIDGTQALTVTGGTAVEFQQGVGGTVSLLSLDVTATAGFIRLDDVTTTGDQTYNSPVVTGAGGGSVDLLSTAGGAITFASTIDNGSIPADSVAIDTAGAVSLGGAVGSPSAIDDFSVTTSVALNINQNITADGNVSLTVRDSTASGENLTVSGTATITTAASGVVDLNAGDDVTVEATTSINAAALNVIVDASAADANGSTVSVLGTISTTFGTTLTGGPQADAFTIRPQSGTAFTVIGNDPTMSPGDSLSIDAGNADVTIDVTSGAITIEGVMPFTPVGIENLSLSNIATLTVNGSAAADQFTVSAGSVVGVDLLTINGNAPIALTNVANRMINGLGGDDVFTVDVSAGLPSGNFTFVGGPNASASPGDSIVIQGTPPTAIDRINFEGGGAGIGTVTLDTGFNLSYSEVESISSAIDAANVIISTLDGGTVSVSQTGANLSVDQGAGVTTTFRVPSTLLSFNTGPFTPTTLNISALNVAIAQLTVLGGFASAATTVNINGPLTNSGGRFNIVAMNVNINAPINVSGNFAIDEPSGAGLTTFNTPTIQSGGSQRYLTAIQIDADVTLTATTGGVSFQSTVDGANGLTVSPTSPVRFNGVVGGSTPLASLTVGDAVVVSDVTTTGNQTYNGVVTIENPGVIAITSQVGGLTFNSTIDGFAGGFPDLVTRSNLITTFNGPIGTIRPPRSLSTITGGPFRTPSSITVGDLSIEVTDTSAATDNLVVPAGSVINASSSVSLTAGDNIDLQAGATISVPSGSLTITADSTMPDPDPSLGSTISVLGTITASSGTTLTGGPQADTFFVRPQAGTAFMVVGNAPTISPGDSLTIDASDNNLVIDVLTGGISFGGNAPIVPIGIENLQFINVGTLTIDGSSSDDAVSVASDLSDPTAILVSINGSTPVRYVGVDSLLYQGGDGDDTFTYDATNGNLTIPITFMGQGQSGSGPGDALVIIGSFTDQILNYTPRSADGNNVVANLDGTVLQAFGLEPVTAGNSVNTILNLTTGTSNDATLQNGVAAGFLEFIDNGSTFEDTIFPNPTNSLTINTSGFGDTLTVSTLDAAYAASLIINGSATDTVTFNGAIISNTPGRGLDVINVGTLTINSSQFRGNTADVGGGIRLSGVTNAIIDNSIISGNTATGDAVTQGGGGILVDNSTLVIRTVSQITGNFATGVAGSGGGILVINGGSLSVLDSMISGNQANRAGGGIETQSGNDLTLFNVMLESNTAGIVAAPGNGGGLHVTGDANVTISASRVFGNSAAAEGGGLWNDQGTLTITGSVIESNFANGNLDPAGVLTDLQGGGGIFNNGGTLVINDVGGTVSIMNNFATGFQFGSGGGVMSIGGNVTITGAFIQNNRAVRAGGGIEVVTGTVLLNSVSIDSNSAATSSPITANPGNGGGVHITGAADVTIDGGGIFNNVAEQEGGGLWNSATGTLRISGLTSGVSISQNIARGDAAPGVDGTAVQGGGGIFNNGGTLILDGDLVTRNIDISSNAASGATNGSGGGVLSIGGNVSISGARILSNEAVRAGGGIEIVAGDVSIQRTAVFGNDVSAADLLGLGLGATDGNGGGIHLTGAAIVSLDGVDVSSNVAASEGGGLWNSATGTLRFSDVIATSFISSNIAGGDADPAGNPADLQGGGGIFNNGGTLQFSDQSVNNIFAISRNAATGANFGSGGGILSIDGNVILNGFTIDGNEAVRAGGGVEIVAGGLIMTAGLVVGNDVSNADLRGLGLTANPGNGGGIHVTGAATVTISNVSIRDNVAGREGGGIWNSTGTLTIESGTVIDSNIARGPAADDGGGGIFNNGGTLIITGVTTRIDRNIADGMFGSGGGIFNNIGGTVSITDAIISTNRANRAGGGIEDASGAGFGVTIVRGQLMDNMAGLSAALAAPGNGGGLHVTGASNVVIDSSTVAGNFAFNEGGGLWNDQGTLTVTNGSIIRNNIASGPAATNGGGGIFNNGGTLVITGPTTSIMVNQANGTSGSGGGIFNRNSGSVSITGASITGNTAALSGGGLFANGTGTIVIDQATFSENQAQAGSGGGIAAINPGAPASATIRRTTINNNSAATSGGGIAFQNTNFTIENVTISTNNAGTTGGGIDYQNVATSGQRTLSFSTITDNTAASGGANVSATGSVVNVQATIFNNGSIVASGVLISQGNNLDSGNTSGFSQPSDLLNTDPRLGPLQNNGGSVFTHALLVGSPARDAGPDAGPPTDARGFARPIDGDGNGVARNDIGAFEGEQGGGTTFVVDNVSDIDDGNVTPGNLSLREAVRLSNTTPGADTITFGGIFTDATPDTITLTGTQLSLTDSVTIIGPGATLLTIDANGLSRIFDIGFMTTPTVTLSNLTLTGGRVVDGNGGAINNGGALTILDSVITGNSALSSGSTGYGGAIDSSGPLTIIRSTLSANSAENDGGAISASGNLTITDSTIDGNTASAFGGGLAFFPSLATNTASILRSTIANNTAGDSGGGIFNSGNAGTLSVVQSTISGNSSGGDAGGIFSYSSGQLNLINSTVSGNVGSGGSGLTIGNGSNDTATITNTTIVGNRGGNFGVFINDTASVVISNSIIAGNTVGNTTTPSDLNNAGASGALDLANSFSNLIGDPNSAGGLTQGTNGNILGNGAGGLLPLASILNPVLANNGGPTLTHALVFGSPAIDAANAGLAPATDQRGIARPFDGDNNGSAVADIGSFEFRSAAILSITDITVNEAVGTATVTVTLDNAVVGGFTVNFAIANGTATAPADYTSASGTLTFAGTAGETQTFTITIINDTIVEPAETIFVNLSSPSNSAVNASDTGIVTITDNDTSVLVVDDVTVNEGAGTATITVRSPNAVAGGFTVSFTTANGTATAPVDYATASGTLTFAGTANETQTFTVMIVNDTIVEPAETILVSLSSPSNSGVNASDTATITIADNDTSVLVVDDVTVNEGAGTATITVRSPNAVASGFTVNFTTANGTATAPADYTTSAGTLTFAGTAGETQTFTVTIVNDTIVEPAETIMVRLSNPSNSGVNASDTATITIIDNDTSVLVVDDVTVNEAAGTATVTVRSPNAVAAGFTVNFTTANGTAIAPADYSTAAGTLTFAGIAGETQTFTVTIINDAIVESFETILVRLSNPSNSGVNASDTATITITDNDTSVLVVDDVTVNEGAGTATITVRSPNAVAGGFAVGFTTANGTAIAPADYSTAAGTLTFAGTAGETQTFTVTIVNDTIVEPAETILVRLSNPSNSGVNASDTATITITDNDTTNVVDLATTITSSLSSVQVSGSFSYIVAVNNIGPDTATNSVSTTTLPAGFSIRTTNVSVGSVTVVGGVVTWNLPTLAAAATAQLTINATASATTGSFTANTQVSTSNDSNSANNAASVTIQVVPATVTNPIHRLTTGSGDGDVVIDVDSYGAFGSAAFSSSSGQAMYNPVGPLPSASAVFSSFTAFSTSSSTAHQGFFQTNSALAITQPVAGTLLSATSQFTAGSLDVSLLQAVATRFDAGVRVGADLVQTYTITNSSATSIPLDLIRYVDGDLFFDGSLIDGGGVRRNAAGELVLFETDAGGSGATDTTFVGITNSGGQPLSANQFDIDRFNLLRSRILTTTGNPLRNAVTGDSNGDGFVDAGSEYDVALALRSLFTIAPGQSITFSTTTLFGTRPDSITPVEVSNITGQVTLDTGEGLPNVTVFIDGDGDRLLGSGEMSTVTDLDGFYQFIGVPVTPGQTARVVVQNPPSVLPPTAEIGVTRSAISTGALSRGIAAIDFDRSSLGTVDLLIANDLSNDVTVLLNNGDHTYTVGSPIQLGKRPQSIATWQPPNSNLPPVIAVAAIGTVQDRGSIYVIDGGIGSTPRELSAGNGPVSVVVNDFNGDGNADFIAASFRSGTVVGRFSGETNERVLATARSPRSITTGFVNNDQFLDLIVVATGFQGDDSSEVIVLLGDGRGNFSRLSQSIDGRGSVDVAVGNFNTNDAGDEIAVAGYNGTITIFDFVNNALIPVASATTEVGVAAIAARDLNSDGLVDIVVANDRAETIELFINQGGGFVSNRTITGVPSPTDIVIANLDNDGILDVAVSNLYGRTSPNFLLPSTATVLGLTVSEREVTLTAQQTTVANFGFVATPSTPLRALAEGERDYDVNRNGTVSGSDALLVINDLVRRNRGEGESARRPSPYKLDVNGDGKVNAQDALHIINHMVRERRQKQGAGELLTNPTDGDRQRQEQAVDAAMADPGLLF